MNTLGMLRNTPDVARHVQELELEPDFISEARGAGYEESAVRCAQVSQLVAEVARNMDALKSFSWNAVAGVPQEIMWSELRKW